MKASFITILALALGGVAGTLAAEAVKPAAPGESAASSDLRSTRETLAKWVETQQIHAKEKKDWQQSRDLLTSRATLLKNEIAGLEKQLSDLEGSMSEEARKRAETMAEERRLKDTAARLTGWVTEMESQVRAL